MDVREIFNSACAGPEGVASKDGGHKNPLAERTTTA